MNSSSTHFNGKTSSANATVQKTGASTLQATGNYQTANGQTGSFAGTTTQTTNGHASSGSVTNSTGQSASFQSTSTTTSAGTTVDASATGTQGNTKSGEVTLPPKS